MARLDDCGMPLPYGLTAKKAKFAEHYLRTQDRLKSLKLAGYNSGTENSANVQACKLLKDQGVKNYMADLIAGERENLELSPQKMLERLAFLATKAKSESSAVQALNILTRLQGMDAFQDQPEISNGQVLRWVQDIGGWSGGTAYHALEGLFEKTMSFNDGIPSEDWAAAALDKALAEDEARHCLVE